MAARTGATTARARARGLLRTSRWAPLALGALLVGCGASGQTYGVAAAALAAHIAATGVNRALTGDCWATCSDGYWCDSESGQCIADGAAPPRSARADRDERDASARQDAPAAAAAAPSPASDRYPAGF